METTITFDVEKICSLIEERFEPDDYSDMGQAAVFVREYGDRLRFNFATDWLCFDGIRWREDRLAAQRLVQELTEKQLAEARQLATAAYQLELLSRQENNKDYEENAKELKSLAEKYHRFAVRWRGSARIAATLAEAAPSLGIEVEALDRDAFLLNTPAGTVDLRTGSMKPHDMADFCTKVTGCAPNEVGQDEFLHFLDSVTCGDVALQEYLQLLAGIFCVGAVYLESLVIAVGQGGNGKSSFFNLLLYVLGDYAGMLSSDVLVANVHANKKPDYAELRGKRLAVAAELDEGMKLDTVTVKRLCSTDPVQAEKKFKSPFHFIPSHSIVLYTNHLPRVATVDRGTWDRLRVIPFNATFRGKEGEVLNYAKQLFESSGGAVLSWMIEGASRFIASGFKINPPSCVSGAVSSYREDNDIIGHFLEACCTTGGNCFQPSGALYSAYREWCYKSGEPAKATSEFRQALLSKGYTSTRTKRGVVWNGLALKYEEPDLVRVDDKTPWSA